MNKNYPVFVLGACHHNTLGVIRSLGFEGVKPNVVIVHKTKRPYIGYSKYIKRLWVVSQNIEVKDLMLELAKSFSEKPVVIACSDGLSSLIDDNSSELSKYYLLPGNGGGISYLMNKGVMTELASKVGFKTPLSITTTTDSNDVPFKLPWIIKPLASKNGSKDDVKKIYTQNDWEQYKSEMHAHDIQIQTLIEKKYEYQLIGLSLDSGREVIIPGVSEVIRPAENTNTGFLHYVALNDSYKNAVEIGKSFLKETKYSGLFSLEFLRGADGIDYFMEINFRNDGNAICVTAAGVNLSYIWYLFKTGQDYKSYLSKTTIQPVYVMPEMSDLSYIKHGNLSLWRWMKDIRRTDCFMEFCGKDPKPFIYLMYHKFKRLLGV